MCCWKGWIRPGRSGVAVGRGGNIFVTLAYMAHNEGSPVYRSDLLMIRQKKTAGRGGFPGL